MNKRQGIPFVILLVAFLLWLYFKPQNILTERDKHQPNYIAFNISNTHFNEMGVITHQVFSDKTVSLSEDDVTLFQNPRVIVYTANAQTDVSTVWQISSKDGILYGQNKLILLTDVWVKNLSLDQLVQTMTTQKLTLLLDQKEISSDLLVTWTGPQMQQQGTGMWGSLATQELIVKDKIKAVYFNEKN